MNDNQLDIELIKTRKLFIVTFACLIVSTIGSLINQIFIIKTSSLNIILTICTVLIPPIIILILTMFNKLFLMIKSISVYYFIFFVFFVAFIGGGIRSISNNILFIVPFLAYSFNANIKVSSIIIFLGYTILVVIWQIPILDKWLMKFNTYPENALLNPSITYTFIYYMIFISFTIISIQYERENREYKRLLADETKKKIDFFVNLAHEIKTPLTLIQNNFDEYLKGLKNKVTPDLKGIKFYISKLCKDITNLLDTVNIERSKILYNHKSVTHLSMIVYRCINFFKAVVRKKNIILTFTSEDSLFCKIDPTALERIVNNLLDNAIKHIGKGDKISVCLTSDETNIYLNIKDNGLGIPVELQKNIFLPYYQISTEKRNTQGLGLGLSIVKHIIDSLSGKIEIESELNKGTKITVILPKYVITEKDVISEYMPEEPMIMEENITPEKETYDKTKYTLFFIEDKIELITSMQKSMKEFFNFYYALDGQEAMEKIERIPLPDIIISDIMMDRMDGHKFHTELKFSEKYKNIPFLFLTARTVQQEKEESLEKGILDYIYKPFKMNELIKKVLALLKYRESLITMERSTIEEKITSLLWSNKDFKFLRFESKCNEFKVSAREKEVIQLLISGMSYKEIAANLYIETTTVSKHIRHIYKKCKVHSNIELLKVFLE